MAACDGPKLPARSLGLNLAIAILVCLAAIRSARADEPAAAQPAPPSPAATAPDFQQQIAPILIKSCSRCHNGSDPAGKLDLTTQAGALAAGESGQAAIVPGKPGESYLLDRLKDGEMPPEGKGDPLSADEVALVSAWIEAGAGWPEGRTLSPFELTTKQRAGRDWWSLRPPVRPDVPKPAHADRVRTPIDAFILSRLEAAGLEPAREADRATLIRRAMFDVWGLPPDPAEVEAFVADPDPAAYERLVDRLLASPHYGERWAQHWLDIVRFAESNGFETNSERSAAWPYRDWVIRALNDDISYPDFIRQQLAGDQCGAPAATGFLVAGPMDGVSSPNEELTRQQRHQVLDDIVSTIGQAFLATTVGCAKCHDHKFDVVSQRDYYGLQALVAGVKHGERDVELELPEQLREKVEHERRQFARLDGQMRALRAEAEPLARVEGQPAGDPAALRPSVKASGNIERFGPVSAKLVRMTIWSTNVLEPCVDEIEIFAADDGRNVALATSGAMPSASSAFGGGSNPRHQVAHLNDGQYGNERSWIPANSEESWLQIELPEVVSINRIEWARDRKRGFTDRVPLGYRIEVATEPGAWQTVATSADRQPFSAQEPASPATDEALSEPARRGWPS